MTIWNILRTVLVHKTGAGRWRILHNEEHPSLCQIPSLNSFRRCCSQNELLKCVNFDTCLSQKSQTRRGLLPTLLRPRHCPLLISHFNPLKPTGHVMHHQFNIQQLYALPTLYLCVLYLSENKQRLVPLTA